MGKARTASSFSETQSATQSCLGLGALLYGLEFVTEEEEEEESLRLRKKREKVGERERNDEEFGGRGERKRVRDGYRKRREKVPASIESSTHSSIIPLIRFQVSVLTTVQIN